MKITLNNNNVIEVPKEKEEAVKEVVMAILFDDKVTRKMSSFKKKVGGIKNTKWTKEQENYLLEKWKASGQMDMTRFAKIMAPELGRTAPTVYSKIWKLATSKLKNNL